MKVLFKNNERKRLFIALLITGLFALFEFIGALLTNSLSLLGDAGHMLLDTSAIALAFIATLFTNLAPTSKKTYGFYRVEILVSFINGLSLIALSIGIVYTAILRLSRDVSINTSGMIFIASIGFVVNIIIVFILNSKDMSLNLRGAFMHVVGDTLSSAAVITGGIIMKTTGLLIVDPILSILLSIFILKSSWYIINEALNIILEGSPSRIQTDGIQSEMKRIKGVEDIHDLHIWTIGSGFEALTAHILVSKEAKAENILKEARFLLKDKYGISHSTLQIECFHCKEDDMMVCTDNNSGS